jgi:hypothetical protein
VILELAYKAHEETSGVKGEIVVDRAHGARSLADGGGHPLHRAASHIANREHTGLGGFKWERVSPSEYLAFDVVVGQLPVGSHKTVTVE